MMIANITLKEGRKSMKSKRFICLFLTFVMCLSIMPISVMANEPPEDAPYQYLSDITFIRDRKANPTQPLYLRSDGLPYTEFSFYPAKTEYDIMLVDAGATVDNATYFTATLDSGKDFTDLKMNGRCTDSSDVLINPTGSQYNTNGQKIMQMMGTTGLKLSDNVKMSSIPYTVKFVTGDLTSGTINQPQAVLSNPDTYTFNFYRKATLKSFAVAYEESGELIAVAPAMSDPYETNLKIENVEPGAEELRITAPAYSQQDDTKLKFDNGSGEFIGSLDNAAFTLDLTKYRSEEYKQADGSLIIPFVLDYVGDGSGVDGHYTLTVSFAEEEVDYTPAFASVLEDAEVHIGDALTLSVEVVPLEGDTESSLAYQWRSCFSRV
jgi:hypothetical protein